jgi:hypothetical protein
MPLLKDPSLRRFWFSLSRGLGVGVTASSRLKAESLAREACVQLGWTFEATAAVEDVDVGTLDQNHVVPNMGPPNFRGVWFHCLNI